MVQISSDYQVLVLPSAGRDMRGVLTRGWRTTQKWATFLASATKLRRREVTIFYSREWHYGWAYVRRRRQHAATLGQGGVIYADLSSPAMLCILNASLGTGSASSGLTHSTNLVALRSISDEANRWHPRAVPDGMRGPSIGDPAPVTRQGARLLKRLPRVLSLFESGRVRALVISQQAYDDWAVAAMAHQAGVEILLPETDFGAVHQSGHPDLDRFVGFLAARERLDETDRDAGRKSLDSRLVGQYGASALASYMAPFDMSESSPERTYPYSADEVHPRVIFFCHVFTDSPYGGIRLDDPTGHISFYEASIRFLESAARAGMPVGVKFHPASTSTWFPNEDHFSRGVRQLIERYDSLCEIPMNSTVLDLANRYPDAVGVSVRGSVLQELAYVGARAIGLQESIYTLTGIAELYATPELAAEACSSFESNQSERRRIAAESAAELESVRILLAGER